MADVWKRFAARWLTAVLALALVSPVLADEPPPYPGTRTMPLPPLEPAEQAPLVKEHDPWEPFNRRMFWFNEKLDSFVVAPAAKGWDFVVPSYVQTSVSNFFYNLRFPITTFNDLLQGKVVYAASDVGRFLVNTTFGVAGFFDPASEIGLVLRWQDFGLTLGTWGVGTGPYIVLPVLGPSSVRDGSGLVVDTAASITPFFVSSYYLLAARSVDLVNIRAIYAETIQQARESSFDYYTFVRNAFLQRRAALLSDRASAVAQSQEDLYHPEGN